MCNEANARVGYLNQEPMQAGSDATMIRGSRDLEMLEKRAAMQRADAAHRATEAFEHAVHTIRQFGTTEDKAQLTTALRTKAAEILLRSK